MSERAHISRSIIEPDRLRSLADEWTADYPNLIDFAMVLRSKPEQFPIDASSDEECANFCLEFVIRGVAETDLLSIAANQVIDRQVDMVEFRNSFLNLLSSWPHGS